MQRGGGGRGRILPAGYHILKKFKQMRLGSVLDTNSLNLDPGPEFLLNLDPERRICFEKRKTFLLS